MPPMSNIQYRSIGAHCEVENIPYRRSHFCRILQRALMCYHQRLSLLSLKPQRNRPLSHYP